MYTPPAFAEKRSDLIIEFLRENSFAIVTSHGAEGCMATHVPVLVDVVDGELTGLTTHFSKNNPQAQRLSEHSDVLVIFPGPHAYVSPSWYETRPMVPTWNYTAVHVAGRVTTFTDPEQIHEVLHRTIATYDPPVKGWWSISDVPQEFFDELAKGVIGARITDVRVEATFKLSQNKPIGDRRGVVAGLESRGDPAGLAVAALMRKFADI